MVAAGVNGRGRVPVIFFDEFDCSYPRATSNGELGWLRWFLPLMEDGEFRDGASIGRLGRSILTFAGGRFSTYEQFVIAAKNVEKGRDFASRIVAYYDVVELAPHPTDPRDFAYAVRSAFASIFGGEIKLDDALVDWLWASRPAHGRRSLWNLVEAILNTRPREGTISLGDVPIAARDAYRGTPQSRNAERPVP